jgi:hypothetical protein
MPGWFNIHKPINIIQYLNRTKGGNHTIISKESQKAFNKIQHPFMLEVLKKLGIKGPYLNLMKVLCNKPITNITLNGEKLKAFPLNS